MRFKLIRLIKKYSILYTEFKYKCKTHNFRRVINTYTVVKFGNQEKKLNKVQNG
jgi:hypothetical protein